MSMGSKECSKERRAQNERMESKEWEKGERRMNEWRAQNERMESAE